MALTQRKRNQFFKDDVKIKYQITKPKIQTTMIAKSIYDLEERTFQFAKDVRIWVKILPKSTANFEDAKQVIRSSGSVGANYIETNESLSKKDFAFRAKICLKEAKESIYWLRLIRETNFELAEEQEGKRLQQEATELKMIFSAIVNKTR